MNHGLPPILVEIAEGAGLPAALALGRDKGGRRVYIPHQVDADHWLVACVGTDAASWICKRYGGNHLVIPSTLIGQARKRRRDIVSMTADGASISDIASAIGIDPRTVERTRAKHRSTLPLPLFDN